jgi:hypothetical protein
MVLFNFQQLFARKLAVLNFWRGTLNAAEAFSLKGFYLNF